MADRSKNDYVVVDQRMASSPYYKAYCAARANRTEYSRTSYIPKNSVVISKFLKEKEEESKNGDNGKGASKDQIMRQRTKGSSKKGRRAVVVVLIAIFTLLYVLVGALSFLQLEMLGENNQYVALFSRSEMLTEDIEDTEEDESTYLTDSIGANDVLMSFMAMLSDEEPEDLYYFYYECLYDIESAETMNMIAYYALPVVFVLGMVVAVVFLIRAIIAICTTKRRKLFILSAALMLVFSLIGMLCGFFWSGLEFSDAMTYLNVMEIAGPLQVGYGYLIMTVLSLLALIASFFAFRSKKMIQ